MTNASYTRTTISIPQDLLFEIKKKALMDTKTVTQVIEEGLSMYLRKA